MNDFNRAQGQGVQRVCELVTVKTPSDMVKANLVAYQKFLSKVIVGEAKIVSVRGRTATRFLFGTVVKSREKI